MKKIWPWLIGIWIISIFVLVSLFAVGFLRIQGLPMIWMIGGRDAFWHHHGTRWGVSMMGAFWGLLILLFVLGLFTLAVVGIVLLVRAWQQPSRPQSDSRVTFCNHCGKKTEPDWQVCPYCGEPLKKD